MQRTIGIVFALAVLLCAPVLAQECTADSDIPVQTYNALIQTAGNNYELAKGGNTAALQSASMPILANSFGGVQQTVTENRQGLQGQLTVKHVYLLDATNMSGEPQFYCGVFGANGMTPNSASMQINGLTPGKYALIVQSVSGQPPVTLSQILQLQGTQWKLAGFYLKPAQANGKDWQYFWQQAVQFKNQNKPMLAYLFFYQTWDLLAPVNFITTTNLDRVQQAMTTVSSPELPTNGPVTFNGGGQQYKVTQMFPLVHQDKLDLVVKYEVADVSNTAQTFQSNTNFMRAFLTAHPELRDHFQEMVAHAVTPQGGDYGTLLAMKDIH